MRVKIKILIGVLIAVFLLAGAVAVYDYLPKASPMSAVLTSVETVRSPNQLICLYDPVGNPVAVIYAPDGARVYGHRPEAMRPCPISSRPLGGSWKGMNYLIDPGTSGWILPVSPIPEASSPTR